MRHGFLDVDLESSYEESSLGSENYTSRLYATFFTSDEFNAKRIHKEFFSSCFMAKVNALNTEEVDTSSTERTG